MRLNEDFFDDIDNKDVVNDETENNIYPSADDYDFIIRISTYIESNNLVSYLKQLYKASKKLKYALNVNKFITKCSDVYITQMHTRELDNVEIINDVPVHMTQGKMKSMKDLELVFYANFNLTTVKQLETFINECNSGFLNKNTEFYIDEFGVSRKVNGEWLTDFFTIENDNIFSEKEKELYDLMYILSGYQHCYYKLLNRYCDDNGADIIFYKHFPQMEHTLIEKGMKLLPKSEASIMREYPVTNTYGEKFAYTGVIDKPVSWMSDDFKKWLFETPFNLYTLLNDDEKIYCKIIAVFNGTYIEDDKEYIVTLSSSCNNMSMIDGNGDKNGFIECLNMLKSFGYSEEKTMDILDELFSRYDDTVLDLYYSNPDDF